MDSKQQERLSKMRRLLEDGIASSQDSIAKHLKKMGVLATQSTISRDLRKLGAFRTIDSEGDAVYSLAQDQEIPTPMRNSLGELITDLQTNGDLVVIHTAVGSASLIAREIDRMKSPLILGTLAGDDTIFVAPFKRAQAKQLIKTLSQHLKSLAH